MPKKKQTKDVTNVEDKEDKYRKEILDNSHELAEKIGEVIKKINKMDLDEGEKDSARVNFAKCIICSGAVWGASINNEKFDKTKAIGLIEEAKIDFNNFSRNPLQRLLGL